MSGAAKSIATRTATRFKPEHMATPSDTPAKRSAPSPESVSGPLQSVWNGLHTWWMEHVMVDVDHGAVLRKIADESSLTPRYIFMTCMSAGIAILGMLLSSPAVVIGAMLLSPLMGPILGAGFALAEGKFTWLRLCSWALVWGTLCAIGFCAMIVFFSPLQNVTEEIAARTRPNLFDLLVALFSSLAGSYAMIRGRDGTIVGVAIATALMPPLAAVGFGLATLNWTVFGGALMLFITNLLTIALTAALIARLYGFRSANRNGRSSAMQSLLVIGTFVALAVPLGISLMQIAREANGQRIVRGAIEAAFDDQARIDQITIDWDGDPIAVGASVLTPAFVPRADNDLASQLTALLEDPVAVRVNQYLVGTDPGAAEQAQLARARAEAEEQANAELIARLKERLALVAGVTLSQVTLDQDNRRVMADARPLEGLDLAGYRTLEQRAGNGIEGWDIRLRPPLVDLPDITLQDGEPDEQGQQAIARIGWASNRTGVPVTLAGGGPDAAAIADRLREAGASITPAQGNTAGNGSTVSVDWATAQ